MNSSIKRPTDKNESWGWAWKLQGPGTPDVFWKFIPQSCYGQPMQSRWYMIPFPRIGDDTCSVILCFLQTIEQGCWGCIQLTVTLIQFGSDNTLCNSFHSHCCEGFLNPTNIPQVVESWIAFYFDKCFRVQGQRWPRDFAPYPIALQYPNQWRYAWWVKCIFLNENVWISLKLPLKFVPRGPINNIRTSVKIMTWHRPGDKPLSEPVLVFVPTHICVTRP